MTLGMGSVSAANAANFDPSNGQWRVFGEYLYWQPSVDDTYFVVSSDVDSEFLTGTRHNNNFKFDSGYRIGGAYLFENVNRELRLSYTDLKSSKSKTIAGDFLTATNGSPDLIDDLGIFTGTAASSLHFHYQNIDLMFAQQIYDCSNFSFAVEAGLEAVELRLRETDTYTITGGAIGVATLSSRTNAIGPKVGLAMSYQLMDDCGYNACSTGTLSLNFCSSASLLAADSKDSVSSTLGDTDLLDVSSRKSWRVVPAMKARVGLEYDTAFSCGDAAFEIGYEFTSFLRGIQKTRFSDTGAEGYSSTDFYNFDMQGLYISASLTF